MYPKPYSVYLRGTRGVRGADVQGLVVPGLARGMFIRSVYLAKHQAGRGTLYSVHP